MEETQESMSSLVEEKKVFEIEEVTAKKLTA